MSVKRLLPILVVLAGVLASVTSALQAAAYLRDEAVQEFAFTADQVTTQVRERLASCHLVLRGGAILLEENGQVSREDWRHYFNRLDVQHTLPGIQGIGFAPWLTGNTLAAHEASVRAEGFPDYRVWPTGQRDAYSAIVFLEPFEGRNLHAFGFDMYTEPVRRQAMEMARDSGRPALSGKVVLVQDSGNGNSAGALMYLAVYRHGMPLETVEQRRAALAGWVYSPYRMNDMLGSTLSSWASREGRYVDVHIYDGSTPAQDALLFDSVVTDAPSTDSPFLQVRDIDFYGHHWLLELDRISNAPGINYTPAWILLVSGLVITGLLAGLLVTLGRTRTKAEEIAGELTTSLRQREHELLEAQRIGKTGSWTFDVANSRTLWSEAIEKVFGDKDDDVSGLSLLEYEQRFTPESWQRVMAAFTKIFEDGEPYEQEVEVISLAGVHAWLLVNGEAVRDGKGRIVRLQGSASDITERKKLEQNLLQQQAELEEAQRIGHIGNWRIQLPAMETFWSAEMYRMTGRDPALPAPDAEEQRNIFTEESYQRLYDAVARMFEDGVPYKQELEFRRADDESGWMEIRSEAVCDTHGSIVAIRGTAADITERKQLQLRTEYLSRLYFALSACNAKLVHCENQASLFAEVCEIVVKMGGMTMAWIGLVDEASGRIEPVVSCGEGVAYLDGIEISSRADDVHGHGPTGTAVRENRPVWLEDFSGSQMTVPWQERARQYSWKASAAIPLCRGGRPIGALTFYSITRSFFDDEIRQLLQEIAEDISFGIDKLDSDAEARAHEATLRESEQRFRILVEQSIAGTFILQDGVIVYVNPRAVEIFGYSDFRELLGRSPLDIIASKDHGVITDKLTQLLSGELQKTDTLFTGVCKDASTVEIGVSATLVSYSARPAIIGLLQDISDRKVAEDQIRRYTQQLEHTFIQTVQLATTISEMRDAYTAGHERRVAEIAVAIGQEMGLNSNILEGLRIGGYLHDVGKITVPAEILAKPTRLTPTEYALIQQHAQAGYDVLKEVDFPWPVAQIALQHHERIDGSGYPQGLKGDEILLEARITAVADVIESMASHRPYRPGLGIDKALTEVERGSGTAYDPVVVVACLRLFREKGFVIPVG